MEKTNQMELLHNLIDVYEANEDISIEEVFSEAQKNSQDFASLNREDIVELKRQFQAHIQSEEDRLNNEELRDNYPYGTEDLPSEQQFGEKSTTVLPPRNIRFHKKYVEAFINNISVPKSLDELQAYCMNGNDAQILVQDTINKGLTSWTVPRWARKGDIVLFMHAKTAKSTLTALRTEMRSKFLPESQMAKDFETAISDQLSFHGKYGGKIYAVGRVNGKPETEEADPLSHVRSRVFCDIGDLFLLNAPIDISEFNGFIKISSLSAVTPLYGNVYERLKEIIIHKNQVPGYFRYSFSTPFPHSIVDQNNWIQLGLEYRNAFTLEIQFRHCYVNYLLKELGDQKTIYMECPCHKEGKPVTYVDNVIKFDKRLLPVEVKLNIKLESHLEGQCEQYCSLNRLELDKKSGREANMKYVIGDKVLVIDTYAVYMYFLQKKKVEFIYDLSDLKTRQDIGVLREIIKDTLRESNG